MEDREEYLEKFRIDNERMLSEAANKLREDVGGAAVDRLIDDKQKIMSIVNGLSESDFNKLKTVLDNPQIMEKILSSDKAKKNLSRILGGL